MAANPQVAMLSSVLDVIDLEGRNHGDEIRIGGFDLIHAGGSTTRGGGAGVGIGAGARGAGGEKNSHYTTALGAEIPQQRVDRMPRAPEPTSSSLPPSGAGNNSGGAGGNGNGTDGGSSRRHSSSAHSGSGGGGARSS